jgi:protein-S-isoprenylcysteine O-methyltransferase Ste14
MVMLVSRASLAVLLLACLISFAWAMRRFFVKPAGMTAGMKLTGFCGVAFSLLHIAVILTARDLTVSRTIAGAVMYLAALGMFWWAIAANRRQPLSACFSPDAPSHLMQSGPYRFVRHPFYCSYLLTWVAGVVATVNAWLLLTVIVMMAIYIHAAVNEERKFSLSPLADAYREYRSRTGLFMPNPLKLLAGRRSP